VKLRDVSAFTSFTPAHRGGAGSPLVLLHGFTGTWRHWELVLAALERRHDVLAPTLAGHAGGPPLAGAPTMDTLADAVERAMDEAGFGSAHIAGNSIGGFVALQLAARGRARSVVALAPAGGWPKGSQAPRDTAAFFATVDGQMKALAPHADALVATAHGRRQISRYLAENHEHIPAELLAHQIVGAATCAGTLPFVDLALRGDGYVLDAERIACPVRIVWGTEDRLLSWPASAARFRSEWLAHADWVVLDGVGHCPQLDVPLETAQLILGFASG
jgi:pimeloyl-ACP methyl ester carboxylesterase